MSATFLSPSTVALAAPRPNRTGDHAEPNTLDASTLRAFGLHTKASLDSLCESYARKQFVLDGLIARGSLNIAAGDSGLGKSPLFYQLALCVAAGIPWLGMPTTKGTVLYVDFENGELQSQGLRDSLLRHLEQRDCPDNFLTHYGGSELDLVRVIRAVRPSLVIVDTLRAYDPSIEENNTKTGIALKKFRSVAHDTDTAVVLMHHLKKPGEHGVPSLEDTPPLQWLNQACGARALINQMDFRLGIDLAKPPRVANSDTGRCPQRRCPRASRPSPRVRGVRAGLRRAVLRRGR